MSYFLRLDKKKKGIYLQMYERYWDSSLKQARTKSVKAFGYVDDLISDEISDPVAYYREYVSKENEKKKDENRPRAFREEIEKNIGYFLLSSLIDELKVKEDIDILSSVKNFQFSVYEMISQLIYSRVIYPCSKSKTVSSVFPKLYKYSPISEDQIYDGLSFIGENYKKYIELFNHQYERFYKRRYDRLFFDCTNYYFEIDLPKDDKQKGPSKENRKEPIIGQALLLDSELVPLAMEMYPGNESEKPYIRKIIEEMKRRYKVEGKTVQVADKGLNCARNIYAAVKEANDGYIFSKSIHGTGLSDTEKKWILLENSANRYTDYKDENGKIIYRLKSCIDEFEYSFKQIDEETGKEKTIRFKVKEKRVVSYCPSLARKKKAEIAKMIEKASNYSSYKNLSKEELGESSKYISIINKDDKGKKVKPLITLNEDKINEDLSLAGYNLLVTSEVKMDDLEVYKTYHNLWKIEECFRITKSFLEGRPVYLQIQETIYGHFLICYLALFLLRVLEIKCFHNKVSSYDIIEFIRDFRVVKKDEDTYINISSNQKVNTKIKQVTGKTNLDALFLTDKEIERLFTKTILID
ncbi:MAG: IS1634 family transposase [Erysipelotrichaceae bacterium]|nr:IS1634 family transposase [Erysipelotrichaceae bacterium]